MRYFLRVRHNDDEPWSEPEEFDTRKERDDCAKFNRIIGGIQVWSIDEPTPRKRRATPDAERT